MTSVNKAKAQAARKATKGYQALTVAAATPLEAHGLPKLDIDLSDLDIDLSDLDIDQPLEAHGLPKLDIDLSDLDEWL